MPLRRIKRRDHVAFYWYCPKEARAAGYPRKTAPLRDVSEAEAKAKALHLDQAALLWVASQSSSWDRPFDGTLAHLIDFYRNHPESTWHDQCVYQLMEIDMTNQPRTLSYREGIYTRRQYVGGMTRQQIEAEIVALISRGIAANTIQVR